ncbi:hypothetical protein [Mesonia aestuariivivens]|uniref:Plasminogen-binding protein PgbA N-terminal domain-containing protein n=1 Tax=Mesonia aestuariivivens TaxID=2796128 RepID=A0ABS6W3J3_9FLAO|nr:hypothetical protein [Mesonia aestuariivivens]MBW2962427.1 hypothetical protein [Mesonia aestuariivivens]
MKHIHLLSIFTAILILSNSADCQVMSLENHQDLAIFSNMNAERDKLMVDGKFVNTSVIQGSPYLEDKFKNGAIKNLQNDKIITTNLRYRIFDDMFEIQANSDSEELSVLKRSKNYSIKINNKSFVFVENFPIKMKGVYNGYVLILSNNNDPKDGVVLYKRIIQQYIEAKKKANSYSNSKSRLVNEEYYFIAIDDKILQIEPNRKKAADAFPNHNSKLDKYIKDNKIKFRGNDEESDLIKLVEYYNTL